MRLETPVGRPLPALRPLPAAARGVRSVQSIATNATLVRRADLSPSVALFRIRPDDTSPHVEPGQYLSLGLVVDGRLLQRPYSTATPAGVHAEFEFLIRLVPGGTFTPLLWHLAVGGRVRLGPPKGLFKLVAGDRRAHLFLATGTGLAPFVGMLETLLREPDPPRTVVIHGVAHVADLAYRERFERWHDGRSVGYVPTVSRPADPSAAGWTGRVGRVDAILDDVVTAHGLAPHDTVAYLCGNPDMISACERILARRGLPDEALRSEHYWPA